MKKYFAESELIINQDGSIFHLHLKPEQMADKIILVGKIENSELSQELSAANASLYRAQA